MKELCKKCGVKYHAREDDPVNDAEYIKVYTLYIQTIFPIWDMAPELGQVYKTYISYKWLTQELS